MKNLLLAKSNIRKNKGLSICISLLILISTMFICISCILLFDYKNNAYDVAKNLNTSDAAIYSIGNSIDVSKEYIDTIIPSTVKEYEYNEHMNIVTPIEFNNGEVTPNVNLINSDALNRNLSKIEIIEEDKTILNNYIYVPYHLHSGGGINIGDTYKIKFPSKTYSFIVKGYINSIYAGSYNINKYEMLISDEDYNNILYENPDSKAFTVYVNYKENVDITKESNKIVSRIYVDKNIDGSAIDLDLIISSRTFISDIFFVSFLLTAVIIIVIIILMITNNISNYIRENMKTLGVLKAMGYTSSNIKKSLIFQFAFLTSIGLVLGILAGYLFMPLITNMLVGQSGIPYNVAFDLKSTLVTFIFIPITVLLIVLISIRKIKKVDPIVALKDGNISKKFRKNHLPLEKSKLGINISLAIKSLFKNIKQNIISFITVIFLCFLMVIAMAMYQNFSRDPKLSLLTFEIVDGVIEVKKDIKDEFEYDIKNNKNIDKVKYVNQYQFHDEDYQTFSVYILEDPSLINNKDNCYKGNYPKYHDEVAISGKYAKNKKLDIGDKITFRVGDNIYHYKITGFIQSTNNDGKEVLILVDGARHLFDVDNINPIYYFDSNVKASKVIEHYNSKYGDNILATMDFEELIEGQMDTFINVANLMAVIIIIITGSIIILVLYLLMKTLIYKRRYEFGILKAVGYRSKDLIFQNVISFMPTIIIGTLIGTLISYFITNPYIGLMMRPFGIMKCTMVLPADLMIFTIIFMILISLFATILMSLKIRKVEPTKLLVGE
ncbi:MAG: ABC transporter permease [Bacilli bacterium]|nr:ABC transporter permease [Bacilli bacterium]